MTRSAGVNVKNNIMRSVNTHILLILMTITAMLSLSCCTYADPESTLLQAESDLQLGDLERAASSCDQLCDSAATELSPTQLCRVALIYAKISEKCEQADYMAAAAKCFDKAIGICNDSIESYIESLNIEDQSYVRVIREVSRTLNTPVDMSREFEDEEYGDSATQTGDHDGMTMAKDVSAKSTASL